MPEFATMLTEARIRATRAAGFWVDRQIVDYADDAAAARPDKTAIIDSRGACTFGDLRRLSMRCAGGLLALGIGPGDVVSLQLPNWREWTILHLAATRIGAITNPLVPIFRDRELVFMLGLAETRMLAIRAGSMRSSHGVAMKSSHESVPAGASPSSTSTSASRGSPALRRSASAA